MPTDNWEQQGLPITKTQWKAFNEAILLRGYKAIVIKLSTEELERERKGEPISSSEAERETKILGKES